jgi:hypothetical protein
MFSSPVCKLYFKLSVQVHIYVPCLKYVLLLDVCFALALKILHVVSFALGVVFSKGSGVINCELII